MDPVFKVKLQQTTGYMNFVICNVITCTRDGLFICNDDHIFTVQKNIYVMYYEIHI